MEIWNKRDIPRPPDYTVEYTGKERIKGNLDVCIQELLETVVGGYAVLSDDEVAHSFTRELAVLNLSLYQTGRHRTEKFYRVLKKVYKCGEQWKELDLASVFDKVRHLLPVVPPPHRCVRLPSKQMFVHMAVRVLGGWHLLRRLEGYCLEAGMYLMSKVSSGHFFCSAMAFLANTARLRALAVDMCDQLETFYECVVSWLPHLKGSGGPEVVPLALIPTSLNHLADTISTSQRAVSSSNTILDNLIESIDCGENSITNSVFPNEEVQSKDEPSVSVMPQEEDIGMCMEESGHSVRSACNKKRKRMGNKENGKLRKVAAEKSEKSERCTSNGYINNAREESKQKKKKSIQKANVYKNGVTPEFAKLYKRVKTDTDNINSTKDFKAFLKLEQKRRCDKSVARVSSLLQKEDWITLKNFMLKQLMKVNKLRQDKQSSCTSNEDATQLLSKTRLKFKFWLLYPQFKGKKPDNWKIILKDIKIIKLK